MPRKQRRGHMLGDVARRAGQLQSGYVYHYAFAMLIGVVALLTWYLFAHGR